MLRKLLKKNAKELLAGVWGRPIALFLCFAACAVFFVLLEQTVVLLCGVSTLEQLLTPLFFYGRVAIVFWQFLFAAITAFVSFFLSFVVLIPLLQGTAAWYYGRASGEIPTVSSAFTWYTSFHRWMKTLGIYVLLTLKKLLITLLYLLPAILLYVLLSAMTVFELPAGLYLFVTILAAGLAVIGLLAARIACYRYFLVPYILADDPSVRIRTAFRSSVRIMARKKSELFALDLSFLPYYLLNILIVPMVGTVPYMSMTKALYAKQYILDYQISYMAEPEPDMELGDWGE